MERSEQPPSAGAASGTGDGLTLGELADLVGGSVRGDRTRRVERVRPLDVAQSADLSFLTHPRYRSQARSTRAGALLLATEVAADMAGELPALDLVVCADPYLALATVLQRLHPRPTRRPGVHPTAVLGERCAVASSAAIGPYVVLGDDVTVGEGAVLEAHVVVGPGARIGAGSVLHPHVVLYDSVELGEGCVLHSGTVVGSDGFGFAEQAGARVKLPQVGSVRLGNQVEIGANSAVDRATLERTTIGDGTKIDNLVQIGHNVQIGRGCVLCGQVGISGSTRIGDGVIFAGQSGAAHHLEIGTGAVVAAKSAVLSSVEDRAAVAGIPAVALPEWRRQAAATRRLPELLRRVAELERRLQSLGGQPDGRSEPGSKG